MTANRKSHSIELGTSVVSSAVSSAASMPSSVSAGPRGVLYVAFELGWNDWKLAFATAPADNPRLRTIGARNTQTLLQEIAKAKARFGLDENAPVRCCYEAGRDGFWLHRFLESQGITNEVVDSSSIEVKRQGRRRKTDRLDAGKLLSMLIRWHGGERNVWSVVQIPENQRCQDPLMATKGPDTFDFPR